MYFHNHDFKRKKVTDDKKNFHVHVHDRSKAGLKRVTFTQPTDKRYIKCNTEINDHPVEVTLY